MIDVQLKLNLGGVVLSLRIWGYTKVNDDDWHSIWCKTDFAFKSGDWLNYHAEAAEVFLAYEIENLVGALDSLLNDRFKTPTEFNCVEPDFNFILNPKCDRRLDPKVVYVRPGCEMVDISVEWCVSFWFEGLTANYLSVTLYRPDIERLLAYLLLVTGELTADDAQIKAMIAQGVIC